MTAAHRPRQPSLPGLSFADACVARVKAIYARWWRDPVKLDPRAYVWDCCMDAAERRFLCRLAGRPLMLADLAYADLSAEEAGALFRRFLALLDWVRKFDRALERLDRERGLRA